MIFSHFLEYCYRCLPSWITSYRIITIENNFFLTQNYFSVYRSRVYDLSIQKILTFLIQWFLSRSQRHQSYFHLVSYFNHFHLQEGVTFCINELHVSFAEMMYRKKVGMWIVSVIIKMVYKRMNPDTRWKEKFTCADI